ncbi:GNAT family N-acetyltransferase [Thalassobaculum sp.]|uniref:GNAT family N-acetyltransferase n=1 Tax=Thalassobaculum sp. TaxID=2022740 RepID=UPI0032EFBDE7
MSGGVVLRPASTPDDLAGFGELVREYVAWLDLDLGFQGLDGELSDLTGVYGPPKGAILLAVDGSKLAGGVALKPLPAVGSDACEMKRLYVRPGWRGTGLGERLARGVLAAGRSLGYRRMLLDTISDRMGSAVALYRQLGFVERAAYYPSPIPGTLYLEADLSDGQVAPS